MAFNKKKLIAFIIFLQDPNDFDGNGEGEGNGFEKSQAAPGGFPPELLLPIMIFLVLLFFRAEFLMFGLPILLIVAIVFASKGIGLF